MNRPTWLNDVDLDQLHQISYLVLYGILCHYGNFLNDTFMNKWANIGMDDGWVHPLAKPLLPFVSNLWWNIIMDNWHLDEK